MERSSGGKKNSGDFLIIRKLALGFFLLSLVNTFANLFLSDLNLGRVLNLREATDRLEKLVEAEKKRNTNLKKIHSRIKSNPKFYKEKFIREYLLMFKKGEKVIPLPKELWYK